MKKSFYIFFIISLFMYSCGDVSEEKNKNGSDKDQDFQEYLDLPFDTSMDISEEIDIPSQTCDWFPSEFCQRIEDMEECINKGCAPSFEIYKFENNQCVIDKNSNICTPRKALGDNLDVGGYYKKQSDGTYLGIILSPSRSYGFDWVPCYDRPSDPEVCKCIEGE